MRHSGHQDRLFAPATDDMKRRAIGGAVVTATGQALRLAIQIASVVILSRLLQPTDFGIFAMVAPVVGFAMLFQEFGLTQALVTARTLRAEEATAVLRANVILSLGVAALLALCAPLLSRFYAEPAVIPIVMLMAVQVMLAGLTSVHKALLLRGMKFVALAAIDLVSAAVGLFVAVAMAYFDPGPSALVLQVLASAAVALVGSWIMTGWIPGKSASLREVRSFIEFGLGMTSFNFTNFISRNADNVMIGWARGATELGWYDRAYRLLLFPLGQINAPVSSVMMPILARLSDDPARYRYAYLRVIRLMLLLTVPGVVVLMISADVLIPLLIGPQWLPVVPIFRWLGIAAIHQTISNTFGWLFVTQGRVKEFAHWGLFGSTTCVIAFAIGLNWGAVGVAAAYSISGILIRLPVLVWLVGRRGPVTAADLIRCFIPYAVGAAGAAGLWWLTGLGPGLAPALEIGLIAAFIYGVSWSGIALSKGGRTSLRELLAIVRSPRAIFVP